MQLKSMKGKICNTSSLALYRFTLGKIHRDKIDFIRGFVMRKVHIFITFGSHLEYLAHLFNVIIRVNSFLLQWKIPVDNLFLN